MNPKTAYYQLHGYSLSQVEYVRGLAQADANEAWSQKPNPPLPILKPIDKRGHTAILKTIVSIITLQV